MPPKSEYDIPSLPPLPPLSDSYNKTTFTGKKEDPLPCKKFKHEEQVESSSSPAVSSEQQTQNKLTTAIEQRPSENICQVSSSTVQTTFSDAAAPGNISDVQTCDTSQQSVSSVNSTLESYRSSKSEQASIDSIQNSKSGMHLPDISQGFTPVFSHGTSSHAGTSMLGIPPYVAGFQPSVQLRTAHGLVTTPGFSIPYPAPYPPGVQSSQEISSAPVDPRLYYGITQHSNESMVNPTSVYLPHNYRLSVPMNVDGNITPVQTAVPSQTGISGFQSGTTLIGNSTSKLSSKTEKLPGRQRPKGSKEDETSKNKKDCADIVVRYLTPYYKSKSGTLTQGGKLKPLFARFVGRPSPFLKILLKNIIFISTKFLT